jgi:hypothetical protein
VQCRQDTQVVYDADPCRATVAGGAHADVAAAVEHYPELYRRIYEWLRAPPCLEYRAQAQEYLRDLLRCDHPLYMVQWHRIQWTVEWLQALARDGGGGDGGEDDEHDSDADTVVGEG